MFRFLSIASSLAAFALAVLGSWVRINGAGMTCPDWPLCNGALVPSLAGGVILEWGHRLVAFLLSFLVAGALITGWRERNRIAFVRPVVLFIAAVFVFQVGLGAATVRLSNSPPSVVWHWGTAMLFLSGLVALAILAILRPAVRPARPVRLFVAGLAVASVLGFVTMCAGAYVSSSGAGLACSTLPDCGGSWFGSTPAQTAQMIHRLAAGSFFVAGGVLAYWSAAAASVRVRLIVLAGFALLVVQVMLGMANVAWAMPTVLREAHAANAAATFILYVCGLTLGVLDPVPEAAPVRESVTLGSAVGSR